MNMDILYSRFKGTFVVPTLYKASAPGTLMLLGEHAVLNNKPAIVAAINQRVTVTLSPRNDRTIRIYSTLGQVETSLDQCKIQKPFQYVLTAILTLKEKLNCGFELTIESDFPSNVGYGSSAAVTVATLAVLINFAGVQALFHNHQALFELAKTVILKVQGVGSGADAAASVYGGIVVYQQNAPFILKQLPYLPPIVTMYSGYKTPTVEVVKKVMQTQNKYPKIYEKIYDTMENCVLEAIEVIQTENWARLGELFNIHQGLMNAIGVGTPLLNELIDKLNAEPTIYGAKISGSGLGDSIIGLGTTPELPPIKISLQGVCSE